MGTEVHISLEENVVLVVIKGAFVNSEELLSLLKAVHKECQEHQCKKIIVDSRLASIPLSVCEEVSRSTTATQNYFMDDGVTVVVCNEYDNAFYEYLKKIWPLRSFKAFFNNLSGAHDYLERMDTA